MKPLESETFDPREFGALADGHTIDTEAIQRALDAAALVRGTVHLTAGTWLSGSLFLRSGCTLHLAAGAVLLGSENLADYPLIDTRVAGIEMPWPAALVTVLDAEDAAVTGAGTIDGNGSVFWASYWQLRAQYEPRGLRWASDYDARRPRLVLVQRSRRVRIGGGLLLRRSGFWTLHICYSERVWVDRITIRNNDDGRGPSTDGIDIDSSQHVLVRRADIAVNDDAIAFKAGRDADGLRVARPTRNVLVCECTVRDGATGVAFGSETSGGFERIRVRRLTVLAPVPVGVLVKSARTRGGYARDLSLVDLRMQGVGVVLRVTLDWNPAYSLAVLPPGEVAHAPPHWLVLTAPVPASLGLMQISRVRVRGLLAREASTAFEVDADDDSLLTDFSFVGVNIQAQAGGHLIDIARWQFERTQLVLQMPLVLRHADAVSGLASDAFHVDPTHPRRDVSALGMHIQDVS
jgi:polygalacturonase